MIFSDQQSKSSALDAGDFPFIEVYSSVGNQILAYINSTRYKPGQVYLEKDVILPYVSNVDVCDAKCLSVTESQRKTLIFFRGRLKRNAGGKIRAKLVDELRNKEGGIIEEGTIGQAG